MNDVKKLALIINPDSQTDTAACSRCSVERSLRVLKSQGYETFVASREHPQTPVDHYAAPTQSGIRGLIVQLNADDNDDLVIYVLPHGTRVREAGLFCTDKDCYSEDDLGLDAIPFGKRTVILHQCYSGNWTKIFTDDPNTLFMSQGSRDEIAYQDGFDDIFWKKDAADWPQRFAAAVNVGPHEYFPQFIITPGYTFARTPVEKSAVVYLADQDALTQTLKNLQPGQYAIVASSSALVHTPTAQAFLSAFKHRNSQQLFAQSFDPKREGIRAFYKVSATESVEFTIANPRQIAEELSRFELTAGMRFELLIQRWLQNPSGASLSTMEALLAHDALSRTEAKLALAKLRRLSINPEQQGDFALLATHLRDYLDYWQEVEEEFE